MKPTLAAICISVLVAGCQSPDTNSTDRPPRWAKDIDIALYDETPRQIKPEFEVFARASDVRRPYKITALLSRNADPQDGTMMMYAIAWRAKRLGADGMIVIGTDGGGTEPGAFGIPEPVEPIYRAHAIVWK